MNELPVGVDHEASELSSAGAPARDDHRDDERGGDAGHGGEARGDGLRGREPSWPPPG